MTAKNELLNTRPHLCVGSAAKYSLLVLLASTYALAGDDGEPASDDNADAIVNPYYAKPGWRLWTEDQTPVTYSGAKNPWRGNDEKFEEAFASPGREDRLYPVFPDSLKAGVFPELKHSENQPDVAGFWDDCYVTLDFAHTRFPTGWSAQGVSINLRGQFINVPYGMADTATRLLLGANFTSQSFARRGRHIVDDMLSNETTERDFFFANCVRATPAHISYKDGEPDQVYDAYDGLFAHSYQSVGQSGSETRALAKMMTAGGCMPRKTKDLLKRHGAYAVVLLTLFKAALPYSDAKGNDLLFENELRHRPAYSSDGAVGHIHFCPANPHYHGYEDAAHMLRMIDMARGMDVAPPVAILRLVDLNVEKNGESIVDHASADDRVQAVSKTNIRIWGKPGETIIARIDVRDSFDLAGRELSYAWYPIYPNQRNVRIDKDGEPGVWKITVAHDPKLPKGRIPVMLVARNGSPLSSNPAFVNFYWPDPDERSDWSHHDRPSGKQAMMEHGKVYEVTKNKRPIVNLDTEDDTIWARPGETIRFPVEAKDPEGFSVILYRRNGEVGKIHGNEFVYDVPSDAAGSAHAVHLIFSDGTAGYTGRRVKLLVSPDPPALPDGWRATTIGTPSRTGTVRGDKGVFHMTSVAGHSDNRSRNGMTAYRHASADFDLVCRIDSFAAGKTTRGEASVGLVIRDGLHERAKHAAVEIVDHKANRDTWSARFRHQANWNAWSAKATGGGIRYSTTPAFLRLIRRGLWCAGFASSDGERWKQIGSAKHGLAKEVLAGPALFGSPAATADVNERPQTTCEWIPPKGLSIPVVAIEGKTVPRKDEYAGPVQINISAGESDAAVLYTLDGQDPGHDSTKYADPIAIDKAGDHQLRARILKDGKLGDVVECAVNIQGMP